MLAVLTLEWPFCIQLAENVEVYFPVTWTSAAAAYVLGLPVVFFVWVSATLGYVLMFVLDGAGLVAATGLAADSMRRLRGEPAPPGEAVDGLLRHFVNTSDGAIRVGALAAARVVAPHLSLLWLVACVEGIVLAWHHVVPVPGRTNPVRMRARVAAALGQDVLIATDLLHVVMVCFLLLSFERGGRLGFVAASASTLILHLLLKRLNDARVESDRRRQALTAMREQLDRRQRLAAIGETAGKVLHQVGRQHGAIGMFAHLLARTTAGDAEVVQRHASQILASLDEANRGIDELLRFGEDRSLNLYPQAVADVVGECLEECRARAVTRQVALEVGALPDIVVVVDKHKLKQALGNLLDNAIDATPAGERVEVDAVVDDGHVRVRVRDRGPGVAAAVRDRLFTPFCTTKPDGIGLGLVLAKELVEAHGGTVDWRSEAPGTVFVLSVPRGSVPA
jgi:signal transduction histidine kinase